MQEVLAVNFSKQAQMKIQQMAFMLIAVMVFFAMVAIVYFAIVFSNINDTADDLREEEARELARQMAGTPELTFSKKSSVFSSSIDLEKALVLKAVPAYALGPWNLDYLMIERVYPSPSSDTECTRTNLAECRYLTILDRTNGKYDGTQTSPAAIVWWDRNLESNGAYRFELGRIHALAHEPTK